MILARFSLHFRVDVFNIFLSPVRKILSIRFDHNNPNNQNATNGQSYESYDVHKILRRHKTGR